MGRHYRAPHGSPRPRRAPAPRPPLPKRATFHDLAQIIRARRLLAEKLKLVREADEAADFACDLLNLVDDLEAALLRILPANEERAS